MTIGERIKDRRIELDLTQDELAQKAGYRSRTSINKIENTRELPLRKIEPIARALECSPAYIMGWTNDPTPTQHALIDVDAIVGAEVPHHIKTVYELPAQKASSEQITPEESDVIINDAFGEAYYTLNEAAQIAKELLGNKELRALFDAARGVRPEDLKIATDMLKRFKETNPDG